MKDRVHKAVVLSPAELDTEVGELGGLIAADPLLDPNFVAKLSMPGIRYYQKARVWALQAPSEEQAQKIAEGAHRALVSRRNVSSSDPLLHDLRVYVGYPGGYFVADPPVKEKRPKPTLAEDKRLFLLRAKEFFGESGVKLTGSEGDYRMMISPALKAHRGLFRPSIVRAATLEELGRMLDTAIAKVSAMLR